MLRHLIRQPPIPRESGRRALTAAEEVETIRRVLLDAANEHYTRNMGNLHLPQVSEDVSARDLSFPITEPGSSESKALEPETRNPVACVLAEFP